MIDPSLGRKHHKPTCAPPVRPLSQNRDFVILWVSQSISALGSAVSSVGFVLLTLTITGSAAHAGAVASIAAITAVVCRLPAGSLADRRDRRLLMIAADLGRALALSSLVIAGTIDQITFIHIAIVAIVEAALSSCFQPAETAALRFVVASEQVTQAAARYESRTHLATLIGPALGGILFSAGRVVPFLIDAVSYLASAVGLTLIRRPLSTTGGNRAPHPSRGFVSAGLRWLWQERFVRGAVLWFAGVTFVFQSIGLVCLLLAERHGAGPAATGLLFSITSTGGLIGALAAPRLVARFQPRTLITAFGWVAAMVTPLLAVVHSAYLIGVIGALAFFLGPAANASIIGYILTHVDSTLQGRASAAVHFLSGILLPTAPALAGVLVQWLGAVPTVLLYSSVLFALAIVTTTARSLGVRQR
ncbi:MFS transporter [Salinispora tropica]|uniref:Major facilitator superfamily MFS_1 n=1 Tax=Salinispora tropica (strain ATCC BAA-916 / DSM 44818 / JCM 13857 / NBRC 105044 / CNB-440) TaxID=369723 RepID=A4X6M3_SALTO|nr:MFS transporter [Salinispora tropica]ABP54523.1 major facilitator superfamily MFS_1 [Salinispora tropica CNB-440]